MPTFEEHCFESITMFEKQLKEVHAWLDEYAGKPPYWIRHRKFRHHQEWILQAVKIFGVEAEEVARHHVISDIRQEGWTEKGPFPVDEGHYVSMGLSQITMATRMTKQFKGYLIYGNF